jgi:hypothetical protein
VLRHRVTVITLGPLGEPEIAIGHEPPIEPWCVLSSVSFRRVKVPPTLE